MKTKKYQIILSPKILQKTWTIIIFMKKSVENSNNFLKNQQASSVISKRRQCLLKIFTFKTSQKFQVCYRRSIISENARPTLMPQLNHPQNSKEEE